MRDGGEQAKNEQDRPRRSASKVTLVKSTIGFDKKQAPVVQGLGSAPDPPHGELADTPETRGMIHKVRHS